jgi:hypothetical protein
VPGGRQPVSDVLRALVFDPSVTAQGLMSARSLVLSIRPASSESWRKVARVVPLPFSTFGQATLLGRAACGASAPSGLIQINVSVRSQAHATK